jgi:RNA polymerase sigma-70 factor (ECF subfamily)
MPVSSEQLYEQVLVVRSQLGDESAFEELLKLAGPRLLKFTQSMMQSSPELVPDLMQEIWVAIYRGLPGLLDAGKFRPWAFRIARDRIYRTWRKRKLVTQRLEETCADELVETEEPVTAEDKEELQLGLQALSPEHREALLLRFFEDMSYEEIARTTSNSVGTVRSRIHYGKQALRNTIKGTTP